MLCEHSPEFPSDGGVIFNPVVWDVSVQKEAEGFSDIPSKDSVIPKSADHPLYPELICRVLIDEAPGLLVTVRRDGISPALTFSAFYSSVVDAHT